MYRRATQWSNSSVHLKDSLIQECITSQCHAWSVAIYSNTTHFHVGHFDDVIDDTIACSNGDTGDGKSTGS